MSHGDHRDRRGLRPALPEACRRALRAPEEARAHVDGCDFCAKRLLAQDTLGSWLRQRPEASVADPADLLDGIYARAVDAAEQGPVGEWLEAATPSASAEQPTFDEVLRESELADRVVRPPQAPSAQAWDGVRRTILDDVAAERSRRRRPVGWRVLLVGAAASVVTGFVLTSGDLMPWRGAPEQPIVFMDLDRAPDIEFANVRYGSRR